MAHVVPGQAKVAGPPGPKVAGWIRALVRAKMFVQSVEGNKLRMTCQYDPEVKAEDRSFMKATPWGTLEMGIDNPAALDQFHVGQSFYVDFTPVD